LKKITAIVCLLLAAALAFGGCSMVENSLPGVSSVPSGSPAATESDKSDVIVAEVNGEAITYDEYYTLLMQMLNYAGLSADSPDADSYKEYVVSQLVYEKVMTKMLTDKGYMNLTDEQNAQAEEDAIENFKSYIESTYYDEINETLGDDYTDAQYEAAVESVMETHKQEELDAAGMTWEQLLDSYRLPIAEEAAKADLTADQVPKDDEVKTSYDDNVASDKADMEEDPTVYEADVMDGTTVYYVPGGLRLIKQVLIKIDDDTTAAISMLRDSGYDTQADLLLTNALSAIQDKADEVLGKLQDGDITFDEAIAQYNQDTGLPEAGYPVSEGSGSYQEAFVTGAYALANVGDISGLVTTDYGYHILQYSGDTTAGAVPYDSVKDGIYETLKSSLQADKWTEITDGWVSDSDVKYYSENY
jgi:parvulin-like peptidyl-prolyl isomerase